jgi:hypothetical protein
LMAKICNQLFSIAQGADMLKHNQTFEKIEPTEHFPG